MNFIVLETKRLLLKGLSPEDMTVLFENFSKTEIKKMLGHRSDEEYELEAYKQRNGYASYNRRFLLFLLSDKSTGLIIGRCGIHNWNVDHRRAEIGYNLSDENYKRKGFMTEALGAVMDYGFTQLNLHRMEALVGSTNTPSLRLMEKYGFVKEGELREHYLVGEKYEDSLVFSILQKEYLKEKNKS